MSSHAIQPFDGTDASHAAGISHGNSISSPSTAEIVAADDKLNIDAWCPIPALQKHTMWTEKLPLTPVEAQAMVLLCAMVQDEDREEDVCAALRMGNGVGDDDDDVAHAVEIGRRWDSGILEIRGALPHSVSTVNFHRDVIRDLFRISSSEEKAQADKRILCFARVIQRNIDVALDQINKGKGERKVGVFAKMSVRSAKDVVLQMENERLSNAWEEVMERNGVAGVWNKYSGQQEDAQSVWDNQQDICQHYRGANRWIFPDMNFVPYFQLPTCDRSLLRKVAASKILESFVEASMAAFRLTDSVEIMMDLLKSRRIRRDLDRVLDAHCGKVDNVVKEGTAGKAGTSNGSSFSPELPEFKMCIILRDFLPLPPNSEFRVFVKDGNITAVSQYDHVLFCPSTIRDRKNELREVLWRFVNQRVLPYCEERGAPFDPDMTDKLQTRSFVIDLALPWINDLPTLHILDGDELDGLLDRILIIEFNPMLSITSGCLFDWHFDRKVLESGCTGDGKPEAGGRDAFEFRVVESPLDDPVGVLKGLAPCYRNEALGRLDLMWPA